MNVVLTIERWPTIEWWPIAGQEPPEAALAADKTSVVSAEKTSVVSRAKTSVAAAEKTPDISMKSTTPRGRLRRPRGVVDEIEMSGVFF